MALLSWSFVETALEYTLTHSLKAGMMSYMSTHPDELEELILLAVSDKQPYSWRAAWLLSHHVIANEKRIARHIPNIINRLKGENESQKRDLVNVLRQLELDEEYQGVVFDICIDIWSKVNKIPSVRWSALRLALQITKQHPALYDEILQITDDQYLEPLSPGIQRVIRKSLKTLSDQINRP